jgi:hypothetical protein
VIEKPIEDYFVAQIKANFPEHEMFKFEVVRKNEPDRIVFLPGGRTVFVELKRPGKEPRAGQYRALNRKKALGFEAHWADTKERVDEIISEIKAK